MDQPDPETQLRLIIKTHAADSEPLLDEVIEEHHLELEMEKACREEERQEHQRSLSALREAVIPALERRGVLARSYPWLGPVFDAMEAALAAHDAALAATHDAWSALQEKWAAAEKRAETAERSLSAQREAVGPFIAVARIYAMFVPSLSERHGPDAKVLRIDHGASESGLTVKDFASLLAAHDAAPATQRTCPTPADCAMLVRGCVGEVLSPGAATPCAPSAPTLTLEEAQNVVGAVVGWAYASGKEGADDGALEVGRRLQALLEQKGASRGG